LLGAGGGTLRGTLPLAVTRLQGRRAAHRVRERNGTRRRRSYVQYDVDFPLHTRALRLVRRQFGLLVTLEEAGGWGGGGRSRGSWGGLWLRCDAHLTREESIFFSRETMWPLRTRTTDEDVVGGAAGATGTAAADDDAGVDDGDSNATDFCGEDIDRSISEANANADATLSLYFT
jgi:hypothetical protein